MKQILIIFFLLLSIQLTSSCQNFIDTTKVWTVTRRMFDGTQFQAPHNLFYKFMDDSVVNDINYSKMYRSQRSDPYNWELNSLWREEESGNIYIKNRSVKEALIYNFNLNEGDTISIDDSEIYVDSTRVQLFGNVSKKYIYAHPKLHPDHIITWIDGVGSLHSPEVYDGMFLVGGTHTLVCFEEKGEHIYLNPAYSACDASTGTAVETIQLKPELIEVFNTNNGIIQLNILNNNFGSIEFYTTNGIKIFSKEINSTEDQICLPQNGIFIYQFINKKGEKQSEKIIVK